MELDSPTAIGTAIAGIVSVALAIVANAKIRASAATKRDERADARLDTILERADTSSKEARKLERESLAEVSVVFERTVERIQDDHAKQNSETVAISKGIMDEVRQMQRDHADGKGCRAKRETGP